MILVLSACGGFFRYCYDSNSYVVLHSCKDDYYPTKGSADEDKGLSSVDILYYLYYILIGYNYHVGNLWDFFAVYICNYIELSKRCLLWD